MPATENPNPQPAPSLEPLPIALVYVPPIVDDQPDSELEMIGRKLAIALDRHDRVARSVFRVATEFVEVRGRKEKVCRILRTDPGTGGERAVADVFRLDYREKLLARFRQGLVITKCALALVGLMEMVRRAIWPMVAPRHNVLSRAERFQSIYAIGMMLMVAAYLAMLVVGAIRIVDTTYNRGSVRAAAASGTNGPVAVAGRAGEADSAPLNGDGGAALAPAIRNFSKRIEGVLSWIYTKSDLAFVILVGFGLFNRDRGQLTSFIRRASEEMLALVYYLSFADRRAEITGLVEELLEALSEGEGRYSRKAMLTYSFGSIVALDVFCTPDETRARCLDDVDTLVTIGSPYDFILTYWPNYFSKRNRAQRPPPTWINVYSPVDVLASQFCKTTDAREGGELLEDSYGKDGKLAFPPTFEVAFRENFPGEQLSWGSAFLMLGMRAHSMYWSRVEDQERNCFGLIVPRLFPELCGPVVDGACTAGTG
jgi:hypothetical protein